MSSSTTRSMLSSYLICTSPRTGSNLLASTLRQVKGAGRPFEYFGKKSLTPYMLGLLGLDTEPSSLAAALDPILRTGTTPNGMFGATLHWDHLKSLLSAVSENLGREIPAQGNAPDGLHSFFTGLQYVWLRRENKVAEGLSHFIAQQTRCWFIPAGAAAQQDLPEIAFDFPAIKHLVRYAIRQELGWRQFLAGSEGQTLSLTYEELASDFPTSVARVLTFLGVPFDAAGIPAPPLRRQADGRSIEWEARFRELAAANGTAEELALMAKGK